MTSTTERYENKLTYKIAGNRFFFKNKLLNLSGELLTPIDSQIM